MHDAGVRLPLLLQPVALRGPQSHRRFADVPIPFDERRPDRLASREPRKYAIGGASIVFTEEIAVEERGRKTYECAGIYSDDHVRAYRRITDFIRGQGALPAIQLGHAGRKASSDVPWKNFKPLDETDAARGLKPWAGLSASAVPDPRPGSSTPIAMSTSDIRDMIEVWRDAAVRSVDAGFDICEIHGAHGYLIHQFLSPLANRRNDSYGGDLNGRMRFALEVTEAVRAVWPQDRPLFFRCSATDGPEGWTVDDTIVLSRELRDRGVDVITCSSGGISGPINTAIVPRHPGYHVAYSDRVRREAGIKTVAVGLITEAHHAEQILRDGQADLIALARELLYNPHWPVHAARELGIENYLDVLPFALSWWLKRREEVRRLKPN
jgi:2,4-dienoyl-CoA reductase-like NADH-dependent reductase (Old Yellow Enzyme family)